MKPARSCGDSGQQKRSGDHWHRAEQPFLNIRNLDAGYGRSRVLFDQPQHTLARRRAVLGRNGAGKTTLMKTIIGELAISSGEMSFDGRDITRCQTEQRVRMGIGYVPQEHSIFARLSVRDNLAVGALFNGDHTAVDRVLAMFPKLGQRFEQAAGTLSGGSEDVSDRARDAGQSEAAATGSNRLKASGSGVIEEITERLIDLAKEIAIVIVEQHLELALRVADYAYVLDRGRIAMQGTSSDVRTSSELLRYLAP